MIRTGTAGKIGTRHRLRLGKRTVDQFLRAGPVEPHAALRRIHRLGDTEAERPEMVPESQRGIPVNRRRLPGPHVAARVRNHMRSGISDPAESGRGSGARRRRAHKRIGFDSTIGARQGKTDRHGLLPRFSWEII